MKLKLGIMLVALLVGAQVASAGSIISQGTPIPDSEVIINYNSTGLDWTYAGPIAPNEFGPGQIEQATYRASEGWRNATLAEWAIKPLWQDFTKSGNLPPPAGGGFNDHGVYRFTSAYWSTYDHVDLNDAAAGRITNGTDIGSLTGLYETWYVRDTLSQQAVVPLPAAAWAGLALLGSLAGVRSLRRRRRN